MLFNYGKFTGAGGQELNWKIDCDSLTQGDFDAIADIAVTKLPAFSKVVGVPRGGIFLAQSLNKYCSKEATITLVVDDVWTTGHSMKTFVADHQINNWNGFVIFSRGVLSPNIECLFNLELGVRSEPPSSADLLNAWEVKRIYDLIKEKDKGILAIKELWRQNYQRETQLENRISLLQGDLSKAVERIAKLEQVGRYKI